MKAQVTDFATEIVLVAPLAGAWIERGMAVAVKTGKASPPSRGRGLKVSKCRLSQTAPRGRPPRGGVD